LIRESKGVRVMWFLFRIVCWTLWLNRNDYIFNSKIISSPCVIIFRLISFLQHWMAASLGADRAMLEQMGRRGQVQVPGELVTTGVG
jgi:hypothetical protein